MNKIIVFLCIILFSCKEEKNYIECTTPIGKLFFSESILELGVMNLEKRYQKKIYVYNPMENDVSFEVLKEHPEITVSRLRENKLISAEECFTLLGFETDTLFLTFYGRDTSLLGGFHKAIHFEVDGEILVTGIQFGGVVIENFDHVSLMNSPCVSIEKDTFEFHLTKDKLALIKIPVVIRNTGNQNLMIRKIEATCGCTAPELEMRVISPGDSTLMNIDFYPQPWEGTMCQKIRLVTNDPRNPLNEIVIRSHVKQ